MTPIYEPRGKAREYSPLALNIYLQCSHRCKYCYVPNSCISSAEKFYCEKAQPRANLLNELKKQYEKSCVKKEQVLFSFVGDPFTDSIDDNHLTIDCLNFLAEKKQPVAILTKAGTKLLKHIPVFKQFAEHIQIGATLTFDNNRDSLEWEPGGAIPDDRLSMLRELHKAGIRTFASFEPVIIPEQSLNLIKKSLDFVDIYKIGKLNNYKGIDKQINWTEFLENVVSILRPAKKPFYIKHDLRINAPSVKLYGNETIADEFNVF